jgi:pimeloyl-ACP methyl ester carboxylesterase/predicted glycosyltransferase
MRALTPQHDGFVDIEGVRTHYEVYGDGATTLLLAPPSPICHSRGWKAQIPYLGRHFKTITFDGRGSGLSDRPKTPEEYAGHLYVADAMAILDELGVDRSIVVSHCHSGLWALLMLTSQPDRFDAWVAISPGVPAVGKVNQHWIDMYQAWDQDPESPSGWDMANPAFWRRGGYDRWLTFFFDEMLPEAHSTKQREDAVGWAAEVPVEAMIAAESAPLDMTGDEARVMLGAIRVPVLVIHGADDGCQLVERGRAVAELTNAEYVELEGAGHMPHAREPIEVNLTIRDFVERVEGRTTMNRTWTRALKRRKRALYVSSPIGLGHARRDVAVVKELRELRPDLGIDWLAQDPVTRVLTAEGEQIHPASRWLASESAHFADEASGHDLHCFQALRRMDEILLANFMVFQEVVEEGLYDLVIADEAWDIDHFWHENPELKRGSHIWFTDFVGYIPMPEGGSHESYLTSDYNAEMIEHIDRYPRIRDRAIFVGNPDDIIPETFGDGLPKIREWTEEHFDFSGYITGFTPPDQDQVEEWRSEVGFDPEEKVVMVSVGGSGVGRALIEKVIEAYPLARSQMPELRMIVVTGPRIDPASLPSHEGLEVHGYVERLYRHLSVCDLAVVQGGLTTTMELAAAGRPFLYFPLHNHFEQNFHVRHRLDQYGAGRMMNFRSTEPDELAEAVVTETGRNVSYKPVETDGAARAAGLIAELV